MKLNFLKVVFLSVLLSGSVLACTVGNDKTLCWGAFLVLMFSWSIVLIGFIFKEDALSMMGSLLLIAFGIYTIRNGFFDLSGYILEWFGLIHMLLGAFIILLLSWGQYKDF